MSRKRLLLLEDFICDMLISIRIEWVLLPALGESSGGRLHTAYMEAVEPRDHSKGEVDIEQIQHMIERQCKVQREVTGLSPPTHGPYLSNIPENVK
jgi:hypothetical protein